MRRVVYSVAASLDGFIAGPGGEFDWIPHDPDIDFAALFGRFDAMVMGRKTWEVTRAMGGAPAMPGIEPSVVSRTLTPADAGLTRLFTDPAAAVAHFRAREGKDIWLFGGGSLFRSMLDEGLVDGVEVAVVPVLLGGGLPLLAPGTGRYSLRLAGQRRYDRSGIVLLTYEVTHQAPTQGR